MLILYIISLCLLILYTLRIITYLSGWLKTTGKQVIPEGYKDVSLIIPVRDEGDHIAYLLEDLLKQDYPTEALEIILVDDHSSDNTLAIIQAYLDKHQSLRLLELHASETGKKAALQKGISASIHPLILNTDGDCRASRNWVASMTEGFSDQEVKMMIGAVIYEPDRDIFQAMQSLEFFSLTACSAGAVGLNSPILCSGANLAYYKEDYLKFIDEQEKLSESGDDIFLMLWLKKQYPGSIRFSSSTDSAIRTLPARSG